MKNILAALLCLVLSTPLLAGEPDKELHEKCIYPTAHIHGDGHHGTGVIIRSVDNGTDFENYVITVAHIIKLNKEKNDYEKHWIEVGKYENWSTLVGLDTFEMDKVVHIDHVADLALITFHSLTKMPCAEIHRNPNLYVGNEVFRMGCGVSEYFRLDYGKVTSVKETKVSMPDMRGRIRTSIPSVLGDSGGPVFHENKLVGISESIRATTISHFTTLHIFHISFALPIEMYLNCPEIAKFLPPAQLE